MYIVAMRMNRETIATLIDRLDYLTSWDAGISY